MLLDLETQHRTISAFEQVQPRLDCRQRQRRCQLSVVDGVAGKRSRSAARNACRSTWAAVASSSIFLHREFGVEVWVRDLWFNASENLRRIQDACVGSSASSPSGLTRVCCPFVVEFFDVILSIDSFLYYGTERLYLNYLARFSCPVAIWESPKPV